jgi:hypothetical protein
VGGRARTIGDVICSHIHAAKTTDFLTIDRHDISGWKGNDPALPDNVSYVLQHLLDYTINSEHCSFNSLSKALHSSFEEHIRKFQSEVIGSHYLSSKECSGKLRSIHVGKIEIVVMWHKPHVLLSDLTSSACQWLQSYVCSPLDKNTKCIFVETPNSYATRMHRTFIQDSHYSHVHISEMSIMKMMKTTYANNKWNRLGSFSRNCGLGFAYVLPKNKDPIGKDRPIVPATRHPLRKILRLAAKAWLYIISKAIFKHFNICATYELRQFIARTNRDVCCQPTLIAFDVKNMFTELKHEHIISALTFIIHKTTDHYHCRAVTVSKLGDKKAWFGRSPNRQSCTTFSFKTLMQLARFELENTYFKVGTSVILKQNVGLSMGGYLSPPLAMIMAMVAEYKWLCTLGADEKFISGVRYVDDGLVVINSNDVHIVLNIIGSLLTRCYPEGLELEVTDLGFSCQMLECKINSKNRRLHIWHHNKNAVSILSGHEQVIKKFIPWTSGYPHKLLFNVIIGLFHRMFENTGAHDVRHLLTALVSYKLELRHLGYPENLIFKAFQNFMCHQKCREYLNSWRSLFADSLALTF